MHTRDYTKESLKQSWKLQFCMSNGEDRAAVAERFAAFRNPSAAWVMFFFSFFYFIINPMFLGEVSQ
jgi:hypothetical protein